MWRAQSHGDLLFYCSWSRNMMLFQNSIMKSRQHRPRALAVSMLRGERCSAEAQKLGQADTTHPENPAYGGSVNPDGSPSSTLAEDADATCRKIAFRRLSIVRAPPPEPDAAEGWVTFQARLRSVASG